MHLHGVYIVYDYMYMYICIYIYTSIVSMFADTCAVFKSHGGGFFLLFANTFFK